MRIVLLALTAAAVMTIVHQSQLRADPYAEVKRACPKLYDIDHATGNAYIKRAGGVKAFIKQVEQRGYCR